MKKSLLVGGVAAALALSACGSSTPAARKAALKTYVASLGAQPNLQVTLSGHFTGAGSAKAQQVLGALTFEILLSNPSGAPLSQSAGKANAEVKVKVHGTTFVDLRSVGSSYYVMVDANAIGTIPGVNVSPSELAGVQLLFGGRWFELPAGQLQSLLPKTKAPTAQVAKDRAAAQKVIDALTNLIDTTPYKQHGNTYSETTTILSFAKALYPTLKSLSPSTTEPTASQAKGSYTLSVTTAGSTATGASVSVTAPNAKGGTTTGSVSATFAHDNVAVTAPSGATVVSKQLIQELEGAGAG